TPRRRARQARRLRPGWRPAGGGPQLERFGGPVPARSDAPPARALPGQPRLPELPLQGRSPAPPEPAPHAPTPPPPHPNLPPSRSTPRLTLVAIGASAASTPWTDAICAEASISTIES